MSAADLLDQFDRRGVCLRLQDDSLKWTAPAGMMTDDLRITLREHRAEIVALLKGDPAAIVAEWRALGADIRLDMNTALDSEDDDAPQWLHLGNGWCYLPEGLRRRIQDNQAAIVRHLREEPDHESLPGRQDP